MRIVETDEDDIGGATIALYLVGNMVDERNAYVIGVLMRFDGEEWNQVARSDAVGDGRSGLERFLIAGDAGAAAIAAAMGQGQLEIYTKTFRDAADALLPR